MRYLTVCCLAVVSFFNVMVAEAGDGLAGALIGAGVGAALGHSIDATGGAGKGAIIGAVGGYVLGEAMQSESDRYRSSGSQRPNRYAQKNDHHYNKKGRAVIPMQKEMRSKCRDAQQFYDRSFEVKRLQKKVYLLEKAAWFCPMDARVHNDLGVAYHFRGGQMDSLRAKDQFQLALDLRPNYQAPKENMRRLK